MTPNPPPDPAPHAPKFRLPPGACDCHAHVFETPDRYPLAAQPGYLPAPAPLTEYVRLLKILGCSRAVLVQPSPYGVDNSAMLAALRSGEFPLRGIALIDDTVTDRQLEELHWAGVQGVRLHLLPDTTAAVLASLPQLLARIKPLGWHLQFYLNAARQPDIDRILANLPVTIVIDHFGLVPAADGVASPGFQALLRLARAGHCWFKLSAPYRCSSRPPKFPDVTPLVHALLEAAPDRCVWGTDWPHPNANFIPNDGDLADLLADWLPDDTLRRQVLVENPARLYTF